MEPAAVLGYTSVVEQPPKDVLLPLEWGVKASLVRAAVVNIAIKRISVDGSFDVNQSLRHATGCSDRF